MDWAARVKSAQRDCQSAGMAWVVSETDSAGRRR